MIYPQITNPQGQTPLVFQSANRKSANFQGKKHADPHWFATNITLSQNFPKSQM
jgi:hypothetical protein